MDLEAHRMTSLDDTATPHRQQGGEKGDLKPKSEEHDNLAEDYGANQCAASTIDAREESEH
jgi:hypothetical protein